MLEDYICQLHGAIEIYGSFESDVLWIKSTRDLEPLVFRWSELDIRDVSLPVPVPLWKVLFRFLLLTAGLLLVLYTCA